MCCYNNFMRNNFDINIPSIPSRSIKFKIQDIKTTAFGSQKSRFHENKAFLTKKFIESFSNFKEKAPTQTQTEADTEVDHRQESNRKITEQDYRVFIPEEKKYMLYHLDKYKNYKAPLLNETKYNRGYSFYRTDTSMPRQSRQLSSAAHNSTVSDSYFFPPTKPKQPKLPEDKHPALPTCVFKNETRSRIYSKQESHLNKLGPGQYYSEKNVISKKEDIKSKSKPNETSQWNYNRLKKIITNIVAEQDPGLASPEEREKETKPNYMFIQDDRDRFGEQIYPIVPKLNVPGPGAYSIKNSLQEQAQKIVVVEEQRKLLKEWFNN